MDVKGDMREFLIPTYDVKSLDIILRLHIYFLTVADGLFFWT